MPHLKVTLPGSERVEYEFGDLDISIGRGGDNLIVLDDSNVSRNHALVLLIDGVWWLRDLDSLNGILHNGKAVKEMRLDDRASFEIGGHKFRFTLASRGGSSLVLTDSKSPAAKSKPVGKGKAKRRPLAKKDTPPKSPPVEACSEAPPVSAPLKRSAEPPAKDPGALADHALAEAISVVVAQPAPSVAISPASLPPVTTSAPSRGWLKIAALISLSVGVIAIGWPQIGGANKPPSSSVTEASTAVAPPPAAVLEKPVVKVVLPLPPTAGKKPEPPIQPVVPVEPPAKKPSPALLSMLKEPSLDPPPKTIQTPTETSLSPNDVILFQPESGGRSSAPVLSSQLDHVLHLKKRPGTIPALVDVWLDQELIREGVQVSTEGNLRFSPDGSSWIICATDGGGQRVILQPDRKHIVEGEVLSFVGNHDYSSLAYVTRFADEDHLHLNDKWVASYHHISDLRLSDHGGHWAYIALKQLERDRSAVPPGERVVTDSWRSAVHNHIRELTLSQDGTRVAYVAHRNGGGQALYNGDRQVHEVAFTDEAEIRNLTFSPDGQRLAWAVVPLSGQPVFYLEGAQPVRVELSGQEQDGTLLSRQTATTRIIFSGDSRHVVFAAAGRSAVVIRDGALVGYYPSIQMDSLIFSPDGEKLALVSLHPISSVREGADGVQAQPHSAVLHLNDDLLQTAAVTVNKLPLVLPISFGGFSELQFSPDSKAIACLINSEVPGSATQSRMLSVNGRKAWDRPEQVHAYRWLDAGTLRVAAMKGDSLFRTQLKWALR